MDNFLFVLSKDDSEAATRCFQFAKIAQSKGHHVKLFCIDDGVTWTERHQDLGTKITAGDYQPHLEENEVNIGI